MNQLQELPSPQSHNLTHAITNHCTTINTQSYSSLIHQSLLQYLQHLEFSFGPIHLDFIFKPFQDENEYAVAFLSILKLAFI